MSNYYYDKYTSPIRYLMGGIKDGVSNSGTMSNQYLSFGFDDVNNVYSIVGSIVGSIPWATPCYYPLPPYEMVAYIPTTSPYRDVIHYKTILSIAYNIQGSLVQANIIAPDGTYPEGYNSVDGYWYVKKGLAFPALKPDINGVLKTTQDGWVNVNGVLRKITDGWTNINGVLKKL